MIYKGGKPPLMIYECISRRRRVIHSMIYQACGLDKQKKELLSTKSSFFVVKSGRKRYFGEFLYGLELTYQIAPKACISSKRSFVYHQGESLVYHHCERRYSLRLMIYSPCRDILGKADDIHDCVVMIYHCFRNG